MLSGILHMAGVAGFLDNLSELYDQADAETAGWVRLLGHWENQFKGQSVRVNDLLTSLRLFQLGEELPPSLAERLDYAPGDGARLTRLAAKLKQVQGRRFDERGLRIELAYFDAHSKANQWRITSDVAPEQDELPDGGLER
jgi:hypothetical protein